MLLTFVNVTLESRATGAFQRPIQFREGSFRVKDLINPGDLTIAPHKNEGGMGQGGMHRRAPVVQTFYNVWTSTQLFLPHTALMMCTDSPREKAGEHISLRPPCRPRNGQLEHRLFCPESLRTHLQSTWNLRASSWRSPHPAPLLRRAPGPQAPLNKSRSG